MNIFKIPSIIHKVLLIGAFVLQTQNVFTQVFELDGTIKGRETGFAILLYFRDSLKQKKPDTAIISNGKFKFTGSVIDADYANLIVYDSAYTYLGKGYGTSFFLVPGNIKILFDDGHTDEAIVTGSNPQYEYEESKKKTAKEDIEIRRLSMDMKLVDSLLKVGLIQPDSAEVLKKKTDQMYSQVYREVWNKQIAYLIRYPKNYSSLLLLYSFVGRLPNDSIDLLYSLISDEIKGSTLDNNFLAYYARYRKAISAEYPFDKLSLNEKAPAFIIQNDLSNEQSGPENYKGKIVIIEFWGLYCYPCLLANPHLEKIRKKNNEKDIVIIAVNSNFKEDIPKLKTYIIKNKLTEWIHVNIDPLVSQSDNQMLKGDFSNYVGLGVPRTVVIDKEGNIVYKNIGYTTQDIDRLQSIIEKIISGKN